MKTENCRRCGAIAAYNRECLEHAKASAADLVAGAQEALEAAGEDMREWSDLVDKTQDALNEANDKITTLEAELAELRQAS